MSNHQRFQKIVGLLVVTFMMLHPIHSVACRYQAPLSTDQKNTAELVFIGTPINYSTSFALEKPPFGIAPAKIKFQIIKTIKGKSPTTKLIEVYWINGTFGESKNLEGFLQKFGKQILVGTTTQMKNPQTENFTDRPWIIQEPCSEPYLEPIDNLMKKNQSK